MEDLGCPVDRTPLSALLVGSNGKDGPIQLASAKLQELPEGDALRRPTALGTPLLDFLSGFSPLAFAFSQGARKAAWARAFNAALARVMNPS